MDNRDNRNVIIAAILGLLLIEVLTLHYEKKPIEEALRLQTIQSLEKADATIEEIEFDGRDATLRGDVESETERQRLGKIVAEMPNVRVVNNLLKIKKKVDPPLVAVPLPVVEPPPPVVKGFQMRPSEKGTLKLLGQVNDEITRNKIVAAVLDAFPALSIDNQIQIVEGEPEVWVPPLLKAMSAISIVKNPEIEIPESGEAMMLKGEVAAEFQKVGVLQDLGGAVAGAFVVSENLVVVPEERDPTLVAMEKRIQDLQTTTRIQFKIGTARLEELSKQVLDQVAAILKEAPTAQIEVQGHTDNLGNPDLNMELSQQRANAVRAYLITKGVDASRMTAIGYGPNKPVATNSTLQGRIANRRVVFRLKGGS